MSAAQRLRLRPMHQTLLKANPVEEQEEQEEEQEEEKASSSPKKVGSYSG